MKKAVLKNFAIFTGKLQACEFITVVRVVNLKLAFIFANNSRSKENKKSPKHPFVDIGK